MRAPPILIHIPIPFPSLPRYLRIYLLFIYLTNGDLKNFENRKENAIPTCSLASGMPSEWLLLLYYWINVQLNLAFHLFSSQWQVLAY